MSEDSGVQPAYGNVWPPEYLDAIEAQKLREHALSCAAAWGRNKNVEEVVRAAEAFHEFLDKAPKRASGRQVFSQPAARGPWASWPS